jgi:hypothetical protein
MLPKFFDPPPRLQCSRYVLIGHDRPARQLAHAKQKSDGKNGLHRRQEGSAGTCLGSRRRPAARILASASGRRARRRPVASTFQQRAAANGHVPTHSESELSALRPNDRNPEGRCRPALRRARLLEGRWASPAGPNLHATDRSSRGRRLLAIVLICPAGRRRWLPGTTRKALAKDLGRSRAMTTILAARSAEARTKGEALLCAERDV